MIGRYAIAEQTQRLTKVGCQICEYFVAIVMCTERVHYGIKEVTVVLPRQNPCGFCTSFPYLYA